MGDGGAVFTKSESLAYIVQSLRESGRDCQRVNVQQAINDATPVQYKCDVDPDVFIHMGYDLDITEWQAACGLAQLAQIDQIIKNIIEILIIFVMDCAPVLSC